MERGKGLSSKRTSCVSYTVHLHSGVACAVVAGPDDALQAPAAPQHELMVQEDRRDWAEEQMAPGAGPHTAARDDAVARLRTFEDISAGDHGLPLPLLSHGRPRVEGIHTAPLSPLSRPDGVL